MLSFWEKNSIRNSDFAVIGAGIMGCSIAIELRQKFPTASIVVLERGIFPIGASTRNAGFLCFGSPTEILHDIELMGEDNAVELVLNRIKGLRILEERLGIDALGLTADGGYELILNSDSISQDRLDYLNNLLFAQLHQIVFEDKSDKIKEFCFSNKVNQLLYSRLEKQIDSGRMIRNYHQLLQEQQIDIIYGANVISIDKNSIEIENKFIGKHWITANQLFICTNAFISNIIPEISVKPGRGQVLITKEIINLPFKGSFHFDEGYYYFRNVGNRVLFGGGRNLDFQKEETLQFEPNDLILDDLKTKLNELILPDIPFEIDYSWQGIMGFTENKQPLIQKVSDYSTFVMACNGMGVALSPFIAQMAVEQV